MNQAKKPDGVEGKEMIEFLHDEHFRMNTWAMEVIPFKPSDKVLDVGCGGGKFIKMLSEKVSDEKIYGVDYSQTCVDYSRDYNKSLVERDMAEIQLGSVSDLPFEDNKFDLLTAVATYFFWPDLVNDFKETRRVLRDEGRLYLINGVYACTEQEERINELAKKYDMVCHTPEELKDILDEAGYRNIETHFKKGESWIIISGQK